MSLPKNVISQLADVVDNAAAHNQSIIQLSANTPELTLSDAYSIQRASMARRFRRGERLVGMKMGFTSVAKMEQMGVHEPIYGHLTDAMLVHDGGSIQRRALIHPRIEPELAFILLDDLHGPTSPAQAMLAVEGVCAALEIIDSRYEKFKFSLIDVVADNASSTRFVLGNKILSPQQLDISNLGMVMEINGEARQIGSSAAILEHPARSLAALANMLHARGEHLSAGQIILAGGATAAEHVEAGDVVTLRCDGLGSVTVHIT